MIGYRITFPESNKFQCLEYPGGESQVRLNDGVIPDLLNSKRIIVDAVVDSAQRLVELLLLLDAIRNVTDGSKIILRLPYLPYSRADRRFTAGDCAGLAVLGELLATRKLDKIVTLDVHNFEAAYAALPNLQNVFPLNAILKAIESVEQLAGVGTLLYPDEGAAARYGKFVKNGWKLQNCSKDRDKVTGKLNGFTVPDAEVFGSGPILIIDDICDGGGTFLGIAEKLPPNNKAFLYVTHGIFSGGFTNLIKPFERIYTTNSFPSRYPYLHFVTVYDAWKLMEDAT